MPARHLIVGRSGEEAARSFLESQGYVVRASNWRSGPLEIDLICQHGEAVVFVEVKTRDEKGLTQPGESLSRTKRTRLLRAARAYLSATGGWSRPCRFDFVGVRKTRHGFEVSHVENAFDFTGFEPGGHSHWQPW